MTYSVLFKINRPSTVVNTRFTANYSDLPVFIRNHSFFIFCLLDYNNLCFRRDNHISAVAVKLIAIGGCSCPELSAFDTLLVAPLYIFGNGLGFLLCQTAQDCKHKLRFHASGIQILFLKHNPIAIITYCIVEKCRIYANSVCP